MHLLCLADLPMAPWFREPAVLYTLGATLFLLLLVLTLRWRELGAWFRARQGGTLTVEELQTLMVGPPPFILDLRSLEAYRGPQGFMRGATCIPYLDVQRRLGELDRNPKRALVVVDETDQLSHRVAPYLRGQGFPVVYVLRGGFRAWRNANLPVSVFQGSLRQGQPAQAQKR